MRELNVAELKTLIYSIMEDNATNKRRPDYWDDNEDEWIEEFQRRKIKISITDKSDIPKKFFTEIGEPHKDSQQLRINTPEETKKEEG